MVKAICGYCNKSFEHKKKGKLTAILSSHILKQHRKKLCDDLKIILAKSTRATCYTCKKKLKVEEIENCIHLPCGRDMAQQNATQQAVLWIMEMNEPELIKGIPKRPK